MSLYDMIELKPYLMKICEGGKEFQQKAQWIS